MKRKFLLFIGTLLLIIINNPTVADDVIKYTAKINSRLGPIPVPKGSKPFIVFDEKYNPVIYFDEQPYQDKSMSCDPTMSEYYYFPVFPRIFYSPCPSRTLLAKNSNDIIWKYPLDEYEGEPIGYSTNGIILHSFAKAKIDVLDFETGKVMQTVSTDILKCSEYPGTAYYDKPNHLLYVYCKEGSLKSYDFQKKELATVFEPEKQFLSKVSIDMNNMKIDSSGRYIIFSETMPSRLSSWGGIAVYDLLNNEVIYREKIYSWPWHVDIAIGKNKDFAIAYRCNEGEIDKVCGNYYSIIQK